MIQPGNNQNDLNEEELYPDEEDIVHYKTLEEQLREIGMSLNDFI